MVIDNLDIVKRLAVNTEGSLVKFRETTSSFVRWTDKRKIIGQDK